MTYQYAVEARTIMRELGADPIVAADQLGNMHFATGFKDWTEWVAFGDKMRASEKWSAFNQKVAQNPSAKLIENYMMDVPSPGAIKNVYEVFVWEPQPGKIEENVQNALQAKDIHVKLGASTQVGIDGLGKMHYVVKSGALASHGSGANHA